jgi:hypothetical protein
MTHALTSSETATDFNGERVLLFIHQKPTKDDKKALAIFRKIKKELKSEFSIYHSATFSVEYLEQERETQVPTLPCLLNGTYWNGLHQIELFLRYYKGYAQSPAGD